MQIGIIWIINLSDLLFLYFKNACFMANLWISPNCFGDIPSITRVYPEYVPSMTRLI